MSDAERAAARQRLEREWPAPLGGSGVPEAVAAMGSGPTVTEAATEAVPAAAAPANAANAADAAALLAAARRRAPSLAAAEQAQLLALAARLEAAVAGGDVAAIARSDHALTQFLFELP
jgi:hypothetical protein